MRVRLRLNRLLQLVAEGSLSQNHWAIRLGISKGHWSAILSGKYPHPSPKTRQRLVEIFGVEFDELFEVVSGPQGDADATFQSEIGDRYRIEQEIGQGGMGTVYRARDVSRGRTVAVKVISAEAVSGIGLNQFLKETRYAARLQHPNILPIYDSGEAGGQPFYVAPLIEGGSLRNLLAKRPMIPVREAIPIIHQVARALAYAHDRHVLHCDIKPENVLIVLTDGDPHVYVADFGIARAIHAEALEWGRRGELDSSAGTPAYVSPEQASGESNLTAASDIYSLGCMMFEMLTGSPPFRGTSTMETVAKRFVVDVPDVRRVSPDVPEPVAFAIQRAMAIDPLERLPTAATLMAAVNDVTAVGLRSHGRRVVSVIKGFFRRLRPARVSTRRVTFVDTLRQDLVYAARSLFRRRGFAAVVLMTLALGIGMNTAIFSVIQGVLFRPLQISESDQVVRIGRTRPELPGVLLPISPVNFVDLQPDIQTLQSVAGETPAGFVLTGTSEAASYSGRRVTHNFFDVLGVGPVLGRPFLPEDGESGAPAVVLISDAVWRTAFGADSGIVGSTVRLNDEAHTVVGIMPRDFGYDNALMWAPFRWGESDFSSRNNNYVRIYGRLAPGVSDERAISELHGLWTRLGAQHADSYDDSGMSVLHLQASLVENSRTPLLVLSGAVAFVLLIACGNVANLTLARTESRRREIAVRAALGAGQGRLGRQFLTESLLTAIVGGAIGVLVAFGGVRALLATFGSEIPRSDEIGINGTVLLFSLLVSVLTGVLVGLAPLVLARADHGALKDGPRGASARLTWFRKSLVAGQFALALMLITGASLMFKSFMNAMQSDLGFDGANLSVATLWYPPTSYGDSDTRAQFGRNLLTRLEAAPNIRAAGMIDMIPIRNFGRNITLLTVVGEPDREAPFVEVRQATPGYFAAMGIPLIQGRLFTDEEATAGRSVTVINQELLRRLYGETGNAVGAQVSWGNQEIIGVVGDVRQFGPDQQPRPAMYVPTLAASNVFVRSAGNDQMVLASLRQAVAEIDPNVAVLRIETMDDIVTNSLGDRTFQLFLIGTFALAALLLGAVGIYGVMSYTVEGQTRELGVRMALGARARDVVRLVLLRGGRLAVVGVIVGLAGAFALRSVLAGMLFDVNPFDPMVYTAVAAALLMVGVLASFLPARRAAIVQPTEALRQE